MYMALHGLVPPPLHEFIKQRADICNSTRATTRGDCVVPYKHTISGQTALSVKGSEC